MRRIVPLLTSSFALAFVVPQVACAQMPAMAQSAAPGIAGAYDHPNSIQPETTLSISAEATVKHAPDIAYITVGVQEDAKTAAEAMAAQAKSMNGVFDALSKAGIEKKNMQTSNFSLSPRYDYYTVTEKDGTQRGEQRLVGYTSSNMLTVKVSDLDNLGKTLDSLVSAGGNQFNGLRFALEDDEPVMDEARLQAMTDAMSRAKLYADAAGLRVTRIVTINESGGYTPQPMPMARMKFAEADVASSPVAGGEVGYSASVNVVFELGQ